MGTGEPRVRKIESDSQCGGQKDQDSEDLKLTQYDGGSDAEIERLSDHTLKDRRY